MQVRYEDFRDNMPQPPICERLFIHSPAFRDGDGGGRKSGNAHTTAVAIADAQFPQGFSSVWQRASHHLFSVCFKFGFEWRKSLPHRFKVAPP